MALKSYQTQLVLGTIYTTNKKGGVSGAEQLNPNLAINSGAINIYISNSAITPTTQGEMVLANSDVTGINALIVVPNHILVTQASGTSTEIVISGVEATTGVTI